MSKKTKILAYSCSFLYHMNNLTWRFSTQHNAREHRVFTMSERALKSSPSLAAFPVSSKKKMLITFYARFK